MLKHRDLLYGTAIDRLIGSLQTHPTKALIKWAHKETIYKEKNMSTDPHTQLYGISIAIAMYNRLIILYPLTHGHNNTGN